MSKAVYIWIAVAVGVIGFIFWTNIGTPDTNWTATYSRKDKNPFGCYVTYKLLPDVVKHDVKPIRYSIRSLVESGKQFQDLTSEKEEVPLAEEAEEMSDNEVQDYIQSLIDSNKKRQYDLKRLLNDSLGASPIDTFLTEAPDFSAPQYSFVFIDEYVHLNNRDMKALLRHLNNGNSAFIAATAFQLDFPGLNLLNAEKRSVSESDSTLLRVNKSGYQTEKIPFKKHTVDYYLNLPPAIHHEEVAHNDEEQPVLIDVPVGGGHLYISSTPKAFTNYHIVKSFSEPYAAATFSMLQEAPAFWCGKYETDRRREQKQQASNDDRSLLSFIHSQPPLKWAFYLAIGTLVLFIALEAKRRQRIIPEKKPVKNSTLDFMNSLSRLYFLRGEHRDIALKKIRYFQEYIRSHYYLHDNMPEADFYKRLSEKSGVSMDFIERLYTFIELLKNKKKVSREELIELNALTEQFKKESYH